MKTKNIKKIILAISLSVFVFAITFSVSYASDVSADNLIQIINQKRALENIPPLKENADLDNAAILKSRDMVNRNYFEHYAYGLSPWDFMKMSGYNYLYAGENLAMDFNTSEGMVNAWMNSPKHRENIMNPDYTEIGFGVVKGTYTENGKDRETIMVSNMFGREKPLIFKLFDYISKNINIF